MNSNFPTSIDLTELDGDNGFVVNGLNNGDRLGTSVSNLGDVNGDGFDDVLIGAPNTDDNRGTGYVVFGNSNLGSTGSLELNNLDGTNGLTISGLSPGDNLGVSLSDGGDINDDGLNDLIIGGVENYVVFGDRNLGNDGSFDLSSLNAMNGFAISIATYSDGSVTNAGDINGDGFDDVLIGAPNPAPLVGIPGIPRNGNDTRGEAFILFGGSGNIGRFGRLGLNTINAYGSITGLIVDSDVNSNAAGSSVSSAGDINGDGFDDIIIGAKLAGLSVSNPNPFSPPTDLRGESYIIFGRSNLETQDTLNIADLDGENGFTIAGIDEGDNLGSLVNSAGDVNGDGFDDIIVTAPFADNSPEAYLIFGNSTIADSGSLNLSELDGTNGFGINGVDLLPFDKSVSGAGDINSDGIDDLIISDPNSATTYLVFGNSDLGNGGSIDVSDLDSNQGVIVRGLDGDRITSVSNGGDINGDGVNDIILGVPGSADNTGKSYIIFGIEESSSQGIRGTLGNDTLFGTGNGDRIEALTGNDLTRGLAGDDTVFGGDGNDTLFGNLGNDSLVGEAGFDVINGDRGDDTIEGGLGGDTLRGGADNDLLLGNSGSDLLFGNNGNDVLVGGAGNDILRGGNQSDRLNGGAGNDTLFGGANSDFFILNRGEGNDSIADYFDGIDRFVLTGGLEFNDLSIVQNINNTQISLTATDEILATINFVTANALNTEDFIVES